MTKNLTLGVVVALATSGVIGGVSFAADKAPDVKPAAATEVKAAPETKAPETKKVLKKKAVSKAKAKKIEAATPEAGK